MVSGESGRAAPDQVDLLSRLGLGQTLPAHHMVLERIHGYAEEERRIIGISLGGSLVEGRPDRFSDLDVVIVAADDDVEALFADHVLLVTAAGGGPYRAYHARVPNSVSVICAVPAPRGGQGEGTAGRSGATAPDDPWREAHADADVLGPASVLVSMDVHYMPVQSIAAGQDPLRWIYLRADYQHILHFEERTRPPVAALSGADLRALDGQFWWWLHWAALRARRGELWEALESLSLHVRRDVLLRLIAVRQERPFRGMRRAEQWLTPGLLDDLDATWAPARSGGVRRALLSTAAVYRRLRDNMAEEMDITFDRAAEDRILASVHEIPE